MNSYNRLLCTSCTAQLAPLILLPTEHMTTTSKHMAMPVKTCKDDLACAAG